VTAALSRRPFSIADFINKKRLIIFRLMADISASFCSENERNPGWIRFQFESLYKQRYDYDLRMLP
jgi:hypothetical protein